MSLSHILLGMLRAKPKSGYEIDKELNNVVHYFWETDLSRIYRTLSDLNEKGWVEFETIVQQDNPNKKVYSITEAGLAELRSWLAEPGKRIAERTRNAFLAQLHFSDAIPIADQIFVLEERLDLLQGELAELERRASNLNMPVPFPEDALQRGVVRAMFSLEYGIRSYRFEIDWMENILRVLRRAEAAGSGSHRTGRLRRRTGGG